MSYKHLNQSERYQISRLNQRGYSVNFIAQTLERSPSTIYRELQRGLSCGSYHHLQAQALSIKRSHNSRNAATISPALWAQVQEKLALQHSPEQIAGQLKISHESIYRYIYADKRAGGNLVQHLRCQKKHRKRYGAARKRRGVIINRIGIEQRPKHIEQRKQIGHWEADTIIGANHQHAIVSIVERKSGYAKLVKVQQKRADLVQQAIIDALQPMAHRVKTITSDNGLEFANHAGVSHTLKADWYFADPYSSHQRGSNENLNGLVRQYIPKKRKLATVTEQELATIGHFYK